MTIKPATSDNLDAVLQLERGVPEAPHWPSSDYAEMVASQADSVRRCFFVCLREDDLLGFAVGKMVADEAELETIVVQPSARRAGIGRSLCIAVIDWAWKQGAAAVTLEVRSSRAGAKALYAGLGFVQVGRRRGYYKEPADDALLMRLLRG